MPPLTISTIKEILKEENLEKFPNFIETGTFHGTTVNRMINHFKELHTIELSEVLHKQCLQKYSSDKIKFHLGDSSVVLPKILPNIVGKSIFFLDGHYSSCSTEQGDKDVPLYEELDAIMKFHKEECIIIIDDARLFGTKRNEDWSYINSKQILSISSSRSSREFYLPSKSDPHDRLIIHLKPLEH